MANVPNDLKYTKEHEWVRQQDGRLIVGITHHAQEQLGDVVYVELPKVGDTFEAGKPFGSIESVKAVSEAYVPVSGKVLKINESLADAPEQINDDPYGEGWLLELEPSNAQQLSELLDAATYEKYIQEPAE